MCYATVNIEVWIIIYLFIMGTDSIVAATLNKSCASASSHAFHAFNLQNVLDVVN